jgi:cellulose synthase/poly-beta-1,6-N-acetylglucosamine synthase-like glycosyltransferase
MIIQILSNLIEEGYLKRSEYSVTAPFFAGANVAFRRQALNETGPYDNNCLSGEDQDICLRIAKAGWDLYFEPKAVVRHKNRMTLRAFIRQWFNYGFHHPYLFRKHNTKAMRVYAAANRKKKGVIYKQLIDVKFPFHINIFLTTFLIVHVLLLLTILFVGLGFYIPTIIFGLSTIAVVFFYFKSDIKSRHISQTFTFLFLRYFANLALLIGGFIGGMKLRMLYLSATFDYRG